MTRRKLSKVSYLSLDIFHMYRPENRLNQRNQELKLNENNRLYLTCIGIMYLLEAFKSNFSRRQNRILASKLLVLPSKSSNRFVSDDVEGCVKCSSTWMPMFSFDTEVPQTGQIEHDGGRSISCRYSSSRRLFISNDATPDHDNITASIRMSCLRFGKGFKGKMNSISSNHNESLDYPICHQLNVTRRYDQVWAS